MTKLKLRCRLASTTKTSSMSAYCLECEGPAQRMDPRSPPLDVNECLCDDCYYAALEDLLEVAEADVAWLQEELNK